MKKEIPLIKFFLILLDFGLYFLALSLTLAFRYGQDFFPRLGEHFYPFLFLFPFYLLALLAFDLYNFYLLNLKNLFLRLINFFFVIIIFSVIYFYFNQIIFSLAPKTNLFLFLMIFIFLLSLSRLFLFKIFSKEKIPVYFWGREELREKLKKDLKDNPFFDYRDWQQDFQANSILILDPTLSLTKENLIEKILTFKITCFDFVDFYERFFGRLPLEAITFDLVIKEVLISETKHYFYLKRAIDLILASFIFLFFFIPLFLPIALLIFINSPGPIFFFNERVGYRGKVFKLIKFRTMEGEQKNQSWAVGSEAKRIFFIGKILRKTHLDELPQLINILKGELSFVGPRPEQPAIFKDLAKKIPFYELRSLILPGLTGWAQVNFKYPENLEETKIKLEYDLYYLKNSNLFLDILIIIKTIHKLLTPFF